MTPIAAVDVVHRIERIAPLSPAASRLLGLLGRHDHEPAATVQLVASDAALTAAVLRCVNSAQMRLARTITTVREAVAYLGDTRVAGLAVAMAGRDLYDGDLPGYRGNRGDLGRHSLYVALAARELAGHTQGRVDPALAFTAGLLHDLGKAVISDHLIPHADLIVDDLERGLVPDFVTGERERMGCDHGEAGAELAHHWRLPFALVPPMAHHHTPLDAEPDHQPLTCVVHLADMVAYGQGVGAGLDRAAHRLEPRYQQWVLVDDATLGRILARVKQTFADSHAAYFGN